MLTCIVGYTVALFLATTTAEARRVALVIGQNAYPGGGSATIGIPTLYNPVPDAARMAELLAKHRFSPERARGPGAPISIGPPRRGAE